jgi:hypothetical protein
LISPVVLPTLLGLFVCAGCSSASKRSTLSLTDEAGDHFLQGFQQAYAGRDSHGNYDIVLIQEPLADAKPVEPGAPLQASAEQPLRHVVHIRVFWRPLHGARNDNPAATNASINWYVLGETTRLRKDMVHYEGAGFVDIATKANTAKVIIRSATLKPTEQRGNLADSLGPSQLRGKFTARLDAERTRELLTDVRLAAVNPTTPHATAAGARQASDRTTPISEPPARAPMAP